MKRLHEDFDPGSPRRSWSLVVAGIALIVMGLLLGLAARVDGAPAPTHASSISEIPASKYRGKYYNPRYEWIRKCVVYRESRNHLRVVNRYSGAGGLYQFLPSTARVVARRMHRPDLVWVHPSRWSRKAQDRAFWVLWNHGKGRSHWYSRTRPCW